MAWNTPKGFNFRSTLGYVTDGANQQFVGHNGASPYPTTNTIGGDSVTYGWVSGGATISDRDRTTGNDPRLCGMCGVADSESQPHADFRVDLPEIGKYRVVLAAGDAGWANRVYWDLLDNTTVLRSRAEYTAGGMDRYGDASGVERTSPAAWIADNVAVDDVYSSTTLIYRLKRSSPGGMTVIAHLQIEQLPMWAFPQPYPPQFGVFRRVRGEAG